MIHDGNKEVAEQKILRSIYIIEKSGVPLVSRYYCDNYEETQDHEKDLLAGFFAALNLFSQSTLNQEVKDIRMGESKYYISNIDKYIFVVEITFSDTLLEHQKKYLQQKINDLIDNLKNLISLYESFTNELHADFSGFEKEIDSLAFELELSLNQDLASAFLSSLESNTFLSPKEGKNTKDMIKPSLWKKFKGIFGKE